MQKTGTGYISSASTVDLTSGLDIDAGIEQSAISFRVEGADATVDENGVLTFTADGVVTVIAYVGDVNNPTYHAEVRIAWLG